MQPASMQRSPRQQAATSSLCAIALSLWSCTKPGAQRTAQANAALPDPAVVLAQQLPAAADECVIVQPVRLAPDRAQAYGPISQADLWAWQPDPQIVAYARATWTRGSQRRWIVWLQLSATDASSARDWLARRTGLDLRWQGADAVSCDAEQCPILASFVGPQQVRLVHGPLPAVAAVDRDSPCAQLLHKHPQAFEVSFRRERALFTDAASDVPLHTHAFAYATAAALSVEREELMADSAAAERALERDACRELWGGGSLDATCERTRQDLLVQTRAHLRWQELRLRGEDDARHARAERYASALERARADAAVDWSNLDDALGELLVRRTLLETSGADPRPIALELLDLLQRVLARYPGEPRLLKLKAELEPIAQVMTTGNSPAMTPP